MRLSLKILLITIALFAFIFTAGHLFLVYQGKAMIIQQLENFTKKKVSIGNFAITPLFKIEIDNLQIENSGKINTVFIVPSILGFITGNAAFNNVMLIRPEFTFEKFPPSQSPQASSIINSLSVMVAPTVSQKTIDIVQNQVRHINLILKRLNIKDGKINFIDHTAGENGIRITLKDLNFNLVNLYLLPRSVITNFELKAKIPWLEGDAEGKIEAEGWLNLYKNDMQATLKINDIDGIYLYPYYSIWVDLEKARIEKAKLDFTSNITSLNNNLTAQCHLELTDIVRKPRLPEETPGKAEKIADAVLDVFKALNQGKIVLDFTIRTKMNRPEFGFGDIKMAFEDKLASGMKNNKIKTEDVLLFPAKVVEGTVRGATDISQAVIEGTISLGTELKKAFEAAFKREPKTE